MVTPTGVRRVYELYDEYMCDSIVIETNQGGNLVVENLKRSGRQAPIVEVRARRGKLLRAEPIAALYERNQVRHFGKFEKCETQMCNFNQHFNKGLCDIVDSTVYALQALVDKVEGYTQNSVLYAVGEPRQTLMDFRVI
jgi:phage terminase large subunit-like protein